MKIVVLGDNQVGVTLAEELVYENNDVTLVGESVEKLRELQNRIDLRTVSGHYAHPNILRNAGLNDADMLIAVTMDDEMNMMACQVADSIFNTPTKIARIRSQQYLEHPILFEKDHLPIDIIISPEQLVTNYVKLLVDHPGTLQVLNFIDGQMQLVAMRAEEGSPMVGKSLIEIKESIPTIKTRIAAIFRHGNSIKVTRDTVIQPDDEVFFLATKTHIEIILGTFRPEEPANKNIMIAGGGNIGLHLARSLEKTYQVKIIDKNSKRTQMMAAELHSTTVLQGDTSDRELLIDENIEYMDVFIAVTDDDEANIMSCLLAKRLGAKQVMALINRHAYVDLIEGSDIDIAISPQYATIGSILTRVRQGDIASVHSLRRGAAEAIEAVAHGDEFTSKVVGRRLGDIHLPTGAHIGAIIRHDEPIIAYSNLVVEQDDHVILFLADKKHIRDVEKLFQVSVTFI